MSNKKTFAALLIALFCSASADATTIKRDGAGALATSFAKSLTDSVSLEGLNVLECGKLEGWFNKTTGDLKKLVLTSPGQSLQAEASLCDAVVCYGPIDTHKIDKAYLDDPMLFGAEKRTAASKNPSSGTVKLRKIPLAVTDRYPDLFSKEEIASADNLVSVSIRHDLVKEVRNFRKPLLEFFKTHKTATKAELKQLEMK
jgi:hypothetical protein